MILSVSLSYGVEVVGSFPNWVVQIWSRDLVYCSASFSDTLAREGYSTLSHRTVYSIAWTYTGDLD